MHCNNCWYENTRVSDSRTSDNGRMIRRRRYCEKCGNRFTTYEKLEDSIIKATNKRNISLEQIGSIIDRLENIWSVHDKITSKQIWKDVLEELKRLDKVAYIRFASVHLNFENPEDFIKFISENLQENKKED